MLDNAVSICNGRNQSDALPTFLHSNWISSDSQSHVGRAGGYLFPQRSFGEYSYRSGLEGARIPPGVSKVFHQFIEGGRRRRTADPCAGRIPDSKGAH